MKKLILVCSLVAISCLYPQQVTQEKILTWINMLDSTDYNLEAIDSIKAHNVLEALPKLENTIWNRNELDQRFYIEAIGYLKSPNTRNIAHKLLDTLINYPQRYYTELDSTIDFATSLKEGITEALLHVNDYSTVNIIFEAVENGDANPSIIQMLDTLVNRVNVPLPTAQGAKSALLSIVSDKQKFGIDDRITALEILTDRYGSEMYDIIKDYLFHETVFWVRLRAVDLLKESHYPLLENFMKMNALNETDALMRRVYYEKIFDEYYTPSNIMWLKERLQMENDPINIRRLNAILDYYILIKGVLSKDPIELIDTLKNYTESCRLLLWLKDNSYMNELNDYLIAAKNYLLIKDSSSCVIQIKLYQESITKVSADSVGSMPKYVNSDAKKILHYYAGQIVNKLPKLPTVKLEDSQGKLLNDGSLQFYEGAWKDAINNYDGTFTVPTKLKTVSLRMNYAFGSQTKSNVAVGSDTVVFQTVNALVKLQNSSGAAIDTGKVQYYAGAWREFGSTSNGVASKELLPGNYSFRMTYAYASIDKAQDIGVNPTVVFQTVPATVQLKNSSGNFIDQGTVQYYSGAWRDFGVTANGVAVKELLPINYSFRMNYAFASLDKQQNIGTNPTVVFQTVPATVQLKNSSGNFIDQGTVQYYSGAWRNFGSTTNGTAALELLPNNYSFRMTHEFISMDKAQDIGANSTVSFSTVLCRVNVKNAQNQPVDNAGISYYSGAWRIIGNTLNGTLTKELLPVNLQFRLNYGTVQQNKTQNLLTNSVIEFSL